jgi:chromosome segregation ATPase
MTTFGKILTVFVMLASVGVGALGAVVYMTRVKFQDAATKQEIRAKNSEAAEQAYKLQLDAMTKERDELNDKLGRIAPVKPADPVPAKIKSLESEIAIKDAQVKALMAQVGALDKDLAVEKKKNTEFNAIVAALQLAEKQGLADKNTLKSLLNAAEAENVKLLAAANTARAEKVKAEIDLIATKEVNRQLEERTQDLIKENVRLARQLATGNTGPAGVTRESLSAPNPPPFAVDGKVMDVRDGLVELSVGGDAGLKKGHTLEMFRTSPKPQYLCMVRLVTVEGNKSVGQIVGKPLAPPQKGDTVASKITGN